MSNIYIPPNCNSLDKIVGRQQIRLGIQGFPNTGKTWATLTFQHPIVANLNRGLGAHQGRADVHEVPFYKSEVGGKREEVKDKFVQWLEKESPKLSSEQTLILDGLSDIENAYHIWFKANEMEVAISKTGRINEFMEWQIKEKYINEISFILLSLKCDVILLCHESERPDKPTTVGQPGQYTGKIRPVLSGKSGDTIIKDYTDWFRQHVAAKPTDYSSIKPESLAAWGMKDVKEFKAMCDTFVGPAIYYWQTIGDDLFNAKSGSLVNQPKFIPANWESFSKYMRKQTTT
jgi:hypothetical protein